MLPVSTDTQWHRGYAWVHLRKAWTVWNHGGNNNLIPSENIYKRNRTEFRESVIIHIDEGLATRCIIPVETGLRNIRGEKENIQMYMCLRSRDGNVDGHARRRRHTGQPMRLSLQLIGLFFFLSLTCVLLWPPHCVINHSIRVGTVSWHHSRYISNCEPVFDEGCKSSSISPSATRTHKMYQA